MKWLLIPAAIFLIFLMVMIFALCKNSGEISRREELKELNERFNGKKIW